jgi:enoyl-CoA hydratase
MTANASFKNLVIERVEPGITVLKISRPKALNALNAETLRELKSFLQEEARNENTRILVLTGDGDKAFIAGADIVEMKDKTVSEGVAFSQLGHTVTKYLELMAKPTIAAVNGFALGGGTEMAISCDFIVASDKAVFGQPEVGLGIIPGFGATLRLAKFVGMPRAKELIFSGRRIKADEAKDIGLVNHVYSSENFMSQVIELARSISLNSLSAVARAKLLINEFSETVGLNSKLDAEATNFGQIFGSLDQKEGMSAFIEKRKPSFQGLKI